MANLSLCLRYYIADRLNNDPGWKNIQVLYKLECIIYVVVCASFSCKRYCLQLVTSTAVHLQQF